MRELNREEVLCVSGGKKLFAVVSSALLGGIIEGFVGFAMGGPAGAVVGFRHGIYDGLAVGIIEESAQGLIETLHPELIHGGS